MQPRLDLGAVGAGWAGQLGLGRDGIGPYLLASHSLETTEMSRRRGDGFLGAEAKAEGGGGGGG